MDISRLSSQSVVYTNSGHTEILVAKNGDCSDDGRHIIDDHGNDSDDNNDDNENDEVD